MGADYYETMSEIAEKEGKDIPMGIGKNCHIEMAIVDKNVKIGDNVRIIGGHDLDDMEAEAYCIKDGIVVVKKNARIEPGTLIGKAQQQA